LSGERLDVDLGEELALTALRVAPKALLAAFDAQAGRAVQQCRLLVALRRAHFFDACSVSPSLFDKFEELKTPLFWDIDKVENDERQYGIFYATAPGHLAYGHLKGHSLFCEALLLCLEGAAATPGKVIRPNGPEPWVITIRSLESALIGRLQATAGSAGVRQILGTQSFGDFAFRR
jgi:hypothetical protein